MRNLLDRMTIIHLWNVFNTKNRLRKKKHYFSFWLLSNIAHPSCEYPNVCIITISVEWNGIEQLGRSTAKHHVADRRTEIDGHSAIEQCVADGQRELHDHSTCGWTKCRGHVWGLKIICKSRTSSCGPKI